MSDLLHIGAHCAYCNVNDFLPVTCKCAAVFCRDHIFPDRHSCSALQQYEPGESRLVKLQRCDLEACRKPSLFAFTTDPERETCDKCRKMFCVDHRHPDTHPCRVDSNVPSSSACAVLQKNFGSKLSSSKAKLSLPKKKPPTDPVKLAQYKKVQLLKMRHTATAVDPIVKGPLPLEQRLTVNVVYGDLERPFWFRKAISTGKALDLLAFQLEVSSPSPTQLLKVGLDGQATVLRNDQPLADQVEDGATLRFQLTEMPQESSES